VYIFTEAGSDLAGGLGDLALTHGDLDSTQLMYRMCCLFDSLRGTELNNTLFQEAVNTLLVHAKMLPFLAMGFQAVHGKQKALPLPQQQKPAGQQLGSKHQQQHHNHHHQRQQQRKEDQGQGGHQQHGARPDVPPCGGGCIKAQASSSGPPGGG
jgi:hypothetical protein